MKEITNLGDFRDRKIKEQEEERVRFLARQREMDDAVEKMLQEKFFLVNEILDGDDLIRESELYKVAFAELDKKPKIEAVNIINGAVEDDVDARPEYYKAALDVVLGKEEQ